MKNGFVKFAAAIPELKIADCRYNAEKIIELAKEAADSGVLIAAFPELCVTGYSCSDIFFRETLLKAAEREIANIADELSSVDIMVFIGTPICLMSKLYNTAAVIYRGKILGIVPKTYLPNYNEFYEARQFTPAPQGVTDIKFAGQTCPFGADIVFEHASLDGLKISSEICEDIWAQNSPSVSHCMAGATVIVNLSASPESVGKPEYRRKLVCVHSSQNICGYVYASAGSAESTTDGVYSGHSFIAECGRILEENAPFENKALVISEIDVSRIIFERNKLSGYVCERNKDYRYVLFDSPIKETSLTRKFAIRPFLPSKDTDGEDRLKFILNMQAHALAKRIRHTGSKKAVIGVSGGLDSTLALIVAAETMKLLGRPTTDILSVTMPCFGTGKRTKGNAEMLCECFGTELRTVDIAASVSQHLKDIGHDENVYDVAFENAQARERTQVLMDIANSCGGIVIGTGDLSEIALGWSTYNGDHMSMYAVNCTVPKTLIRYMVGIYADICNDERLAAVLRDILDTPVSPELVPSKPGEISQKTEEIIGDYDLHDFFLYNFIRYGYTPDKLYRIASIAFEGVFTPEYIKKTLTTFIRRFFTQQFKRSCSPDGVKVGSVALSPRADLRMPSDASFDEWINDIK